MAISSGGDRHWSDRHRDFRDVINYIPFALTLSSAITVAGVYVLRRNEPTAAMPGRGAIRSSLIFLLVSLWMLTFMLLDKDARWPSLLGLSTILTGLVVYAILRNRRAPTRRSIAMKTFLFLLIAVTALHAEVSPNDTAKFLAGIAVGHSARRAEPQPCVGRARHGVRQAWQQLGRDSCKIRAWGRVPRQRLHRSRAHVLFLQRARQSLRAGLLPNATTYVLAPSSRSHTPDIVHLPPGALEAGLANLRKSLNSVLTSRSSLPRT